MSENVVIDLENRTVTRYVTRFNTRYVTNYRYNTIYRTRVVDVATAVVVNYVLNGRVVTSLTIPTRFVLGENIIESSGGSQSVPRSVTPPENKAWVQPTPGERKRRKTYVMA